MALLESLNASEREFEGLMRTLNVPVDSLLKPSKGLKPDEALYETKQLGIYVEHSLKP
jgi:hypothetical protein